MTSFLHNIFSPKPKMLQAQPSFSNAIRLNHGIDTASHKVNKLERRFLVWTGRFKNLEEVPNFVSQSTMERARNRMRIKIANYMMIATALGCIAMVYSGKQAKKRGESVQKENLEWHKRVNEGKE